MGDGSASGVETPSQSGVMVRKGENFPIIPPPLLKLPIEELHAKRVRLSSALSAETHSPLPNLKTEEELENAMVVYQFAEEAARRQQEAPVVP